MRKLVSSARFLAVFLVLIQGIYAWSPLAFQEATVRVTEKGFEPALLELEPNLPAKLTFVRETDATCATEVILPEYDIEADLPLNERVLVEFTPDKTGQFSFACGMNMIKGKLVVSEN